MKASQIHGWVQDGKIYLSLRKREENWAKNVYDSPHDAMAEVSKRGLPIIWENSDDIDNHASMKP